MHTSPPNRLCDAHCHLGATPPIDEYLVLNATSPADWPRISQRTAKNTRTIPAIGLHPWQVHNAPRDWQNQFLSALDDGARGVGEIGLDQHLAEATLDLQCAAFAWQLDQAAKRNLPVSIHCLKATGPLLRLLRQGNLPARGIHLHAYSGSAEETAQFAELGAYFSFHAAQLQAPARKAPDALRQIPLNRLLIESDAPDTLPKMMHLQDYLQAAYQRAASIREVDLTALTEQVSANFHRYFLDD